jgi:hypothetical protein
MLPQQLQGLLKQDWKQTLVGEIKNKVSQFGLSNLGGLASGFNFGKHESN